VRLLMARSPSSVTPGQSFIEGEGCEAAPPLVTVVCGLERWTVGRVPSWEKC
jgi:hypothetical protein